MIYYEAKPKKSIGFIIICLFLIIIIYILVNLINKVDYQVSSVYKEETSKVTSFMSNEINVENLIDNSLYSIVGVSKIKEKSTTSFYNDSENILGMASGVIISKEGYILTNRHVTGGLYSTCYISLRNGDNYTGQVVWEDENLDISIVKTNAVNLLSMSFADVKNCSLGERVYLLSNYTGYELQQMVEEGIISKINDTFKMKLEDKEIYVEDVIKVNIESTKYNTGGGVLNEKGELIGIISKYNNSVIPISRISGVLDKLIKDGKCEKIELGIYGFDNDVLNYLDSKMQIENGVYIEKIDDDSIFKGLLEENNIITRVDGIKVSLMSEIKEYTLRKNKGETLIVSVIKGNVEKDIEVVL